MKNQVTEKRFYVDPTGELRIPETSIPLKDIIKLTAEDLKTITITLTGCTDDEYYDDLVDLLIEWLMTEEKLTAREAIEEMNRPLIMNWWHRHFIKRESLLSAKLADFYDKRLKLQPQKMEPSLKVIAACAETYSLWIRMHRRCLQEGSWQHRHLKESYAHLNKI